MTNTILNVPGMSCDHCARTITTTLTPIAGVGQVRVDLPARQVYVEYDEAQTKLERIKAALQTVGYPVASVEPGQEVGPVQRVSVPGSRPAGCACCRS